MSVCEYRDIDVSTLLLLSGLLMLGGSASKRDREREREKEKREACARPRDVGGGHFSDVTGAQHTTSRDIILTIKKKSHPPRSKIFF